MQGNIKWLNEIGQLVRKPVVYKKNTKKNLTIISNNTSLLLFE